MAKNNRIRMAIIVAAVLLLLGGGTYGFRTYANSRKLNALQTKAAEMFSQQGQGFGPGTSSPASDEQRRANFRELHEQVATLPESYQQQFHQSMGNMFMQRAEQRFDEYLALSKPERKKYLDKVIAEGEQRRKQWEARRKQMETERAQQVAANGTNGANPPGPGNNDHRPRGGWGSQSGRLDRTSPEFRAKSAVFRRDMEQRRKELGLSEWGHWGRR